MDSKKIGQFIAMQRKQRAMTQQDLADKLNITNRAVSKWETGEGYPDITVLPALAEIFNVTVDELLAGKKNPDNANYIKEDQQKSKLLDISVDRFSSLYLICLGIMMLGIVLSIFSLNLYNGVWTSLGYSLLISAFFLIITMMFYINICKNLKATLQEYNSIFINKTVYKKHIIFWMVYLIQVTICICMIPLWPFASRGYYRVFHALFGYNSHGWLVIDFNVCIAICLLVYGILFTAGLLIIKKKRAKP